MQGYAVTYFNEIIKIDYQGFIIDIDLKSYFEIANDKIEIINSSRLDSTR